MRALVHLILALACTALLSACGGGGGGSSTEPPAAADTVAETVATWNSAIRDDIDGSGVSISGASEFNLYAMVSIAVHDALNGIEARYRQRYPDGVALQPTALPEAAASRAARDVLSNYLPGARTVIDARHGVALAALPAGSARDLGESVGAAAAARVIAARQGAGLEANQRFALTSVAQFRAAPPYGVPSGSADYQAAAALTTGYATDFAEVRCLGRRADIVIAGCADRTADQTEVARFWLESVTQGWNRIAATVAEQTGLGGWERARLFALLHIALVDSQLAINDSKDTYDILRPVQAIPSAAADGNPATVPVTGWQPLVTTPESPDYPSAHAAGGDAAIAVLEAVFPPDTAFTTTSTSAPGASRPYASFEAAAAENALSRILVGFHFRHATEVGRQLGREVGDWAIAQTLTAR